MTYANFRAAYLLVFGVMGLGGCDMQFDNDEVASDGPSDEVIMLDDAHLAGLGERVEINDNSDEMLAPRYRVTDSGAIEVTFRHNAPDATSVFLAGEMNNWNGDSLPMTQNAQGIWQLSMELAPGPWLYKFVTDNTWAADPNAPAFIPDGFGGANGIVVAGEVPDAQVYHPDIAHGELHELTFDSAALGGDAEALIYTPPGYAESGIDYPVVYLLHGFGMDRYQWVDDGLIVTFMDNLLDEGSIQPFIIVMPSAGTSFYLNEYQTMITEELRAEISATYRVVDDASSTAVAGVSMGGLGAINFALMRPDLFGFSVSLSGAFTDLFFQGWAEFTMPTLNYEPLIYVGNGDTLDISVGPDSQVTTIYEGNIALGELFDSRDIDYDMSVGNGGHDWRYWHGVTPEVLIQISGFFATK